MYPFCHKKGQKSLILLWKDFWFLKKRLLCFNWSRMFFEEPFLANIKYQRKSVHIKKIGNHLFLSLLWEILYSSLVCQEISSRLTGNSLAINQLAMAFLDHKVSDEELFAYNRWPQKISGCKGDWQKNVLQILCGKCARNIFTWGNILWK